MMQCADSSSNERPRIAIDRNKKSVGFRQWPEVYDLCHTFCTLRETQRVRKHTDMRELHAKRATKSDTSSHCLVG